MKEKQKKIIKTEKKTIPEFKKDESHYKEFFNTARDILYTLDLEGKFTDVNEAVTKILGFTREEIIGKNMRDVTTKESYAIALKEMKTKIKGEEQESFYEVEVFSKDGHILTFEINSFIKIVDNKPTQILGIARNISERKKFEAKLKETEERYKALFDRSLDCVYIHDFDGNFIDANEAALILTGYNKDEIKLLNFRALIGEEEFSKTVMVIEELKLYGTQKSYTEYKVRKKDGAQLIIETKSSVIYHNNQPYAIQVIARDITERKFMEEALKDSEINLKEFILAHPDPIHLLDPDGVILLCNEKLANLIESTPEKLMGTKTIPFVSKEVESEKRSILEKVIQSKQTFRYEEKIRDQYFDTSVAPIINSKGEVSKVAVFPHNITAKIINEKLRYKSETLYKTLFELSPNGILLEDKSGNIIDVNTAYCKSKGFSRDELLKMNVRNLASPETNVDIGKNISDILSGKTLRHDLRDRKKDGSIRFVEINETKVMLPDGEPAILCVTVDITERVMAQQSLKEIETIFNLFLEYSPYYVFFKDEQIKSHILSKNFERMLGKPIKELLGKTMDELFPSDFAKKMLEDDRKVLMDGKLVEIEEEFNGKYYSTLKFPIFIDEKPKFLAGFTIDITERKLSEIALRESEKKYRALVDTTDTGYVILDVEGRVVDANKEYVRLSGHTSLKEIINHNVTEWTAPYDISRNYEEIKKCFETGYVRNLIIDYVDKAGGSIPVEVNATVLYEASGTKILSLCRDITERKKAEQALFESENELRTLFSSITDLIILFDEIGTILKVAPTNPSVVYLPPDQILGKKLNDIFDSEQADYFFSLITECLRTKKTTPAEYSLSINGQEYAFDSRMSPLTEHTVLLVAREVTEKKRAEQERLRLQNLESLGVLAGGIAHDFNNILSTILGRTSLALEYIGDGNIKNDLISIEKATRRAVSLTNQLLTFAKGGTPEKSIINTRKIIDDTTRFALSGSNIITSFAFNDTFQVQADEGQISQVIQNLVINAKQAMPGGGTIFITVDDFIDDLQNKFLKIVIQDQGIGISKEHTSKIFDPYFSTKQTGSGLGLSVCHSIIRRHEGKIFLESELGIGTKFTILLPASEKTDRINDKPKNVITKKLRVLVMDDEKDIRELLEFLLLSLGHHVSTSKEGGETIRMYKESMGTENSYDVLILDLTVKGGLGGKETIKIIRGLDPKAKAIVSSGYADSSISNYKESGFDCLLKKPYTIEELNDALFNVYNIIKS